MNDISEETNKEVTYLQTLHCMHSLNKDFSNKHQIKLKLPSFKYSSGGIPEMVAQNVIHISVTSLLLPKLSYSQVSVNLFKVAE